MLRVKKRARGRANEVTGSLVLLVISLVFALSLAEYIFRTVKEIQWRRAAKYWQHELYATLPDSPLEYELHRGAVRENRIPDTGQTWQYRINTDGFRGEDFDVRDNRKRVLFIGDSYTFGWAVDQDEVLTESVERVLAKLPYELAINAYNLGVPGYNTVQEYHLLNKVMDHYSADLVVLGYVMNDGEPQQNVPVRPSIRYKYVSSWLLAYIKDNLNYYIFNGDSILDTGINLHTKYLLAAKENGPKWAEGRQAFTDMVALCDRRGIPILVVIHPDYTAPFGDRYPYRMIHEEVLSWADDQDVTVVDMFQYMKGKNNKKYNVEGDGHPNGRAFSETAQVIAPLIYGYLEGSAP
jgi:hypothetical protein